MLFQALGDVLVRHEDHLVRFDELLRGVFDSEGKDPLIGYIIPNRSTLDDMLTRLEQATDTSAPREPWVQRGIRSLRGELKAKMVSTAPEGPQASSSIVELVAADAEEGDTGAMEFEVDEAAPAQLPEGHGPSTPSAE